MNFNFNPIDATSAINWHTSQWNNIGNAVRSGADALDSFARQKAQWDQMKREQMEAENKRRSFQNNIDNIRNNIANDSKIVDAQNRLKTADSRLSAAQTNFENSIMDGAQGKQFDSASDSWNLEPSVYTEKGLRQPELPELDDISDPDVPVELSEARVERQKAEDDIDELGTLSSFADYLADPAFELALQQAEQAQSYEPLIRYIDNFNNIKYRNERDAVNDARLDAEAKKNGDELIKAGNDARMTYFLTNELSKLEGLRDNLDKNGRVKRGPYAGRTMDDLIAETIAKYEPMMGTEALYSALNNHKTMSEYSKLMARRSSAPPPKKRRL